MKTIKKKSVPHQEVRLYLGSRENYNGQIFSREVLLHTIENFQLVQPELIPVRVTDTGFKAGDYWELGWELAVINYPRRPRDEKELSEFMHSLAQHLLIVLRQNRISIVERDEITMYEHPNAVEKH